MTEKNKNSEISIAMGVAFCVVFGNIAIGGGIGVVIGVIFATYKNRK
jgi:hypothetical protein